MSGSRGAAAGINPCAGVAAYLFAVIEHGEVEVDPSPMAEAYGGMGARLLLQVDPIRVPGAEHYAVKKERTYRIIRSMAYRPSGQYHEDKKEKPRDCNIPHIDLSAQTFIRCHGNHPEIADHGNSIMSN